MNTTGHTLKRIMAGALLSGIVAIASLGLATGSAQAKRSFQWCPGQPLPTAWMKGPDGYGIEVHPAITWDMTVCHDYWTVDGQVIEGEPPSCPPLAFMCP